MFRPATPLTILVFVAFALLLISVLSTPIIKGITLASYRGVDFGVFGYCRGSRCSGMRVGYEPDNQLGDGTDFTLPRQARNSLSSLLIVHAIAALFTLVLLILAVAAHLHSPAHSPRYLLALLILILPTLLLSLLAFLVDILLFVPHLGWGGWIVLAATIVLAVCGIITCGMRRALVSRKAHRKRIAENAEMNGENYYSQAAASAPPPLSREPTTPTVVDGSGPDKLPEFATFDVRGKRDEGPNQEERIPLNPRAPAHARDPGGVPSMAGTDHAVSAFRAPHRSETGSSSSSGGARPPPGAFPSRQRSGLDGPGSMHNQLGNFSDPRLQSSNSGPGPRHPGSFSHHGGAGRGGPAPAGPGGYGRGGFAGPWRGPSTQAMHGDGRAPGPGPVGSPVGAIAGGQGRGGLPPSPNRTNAPGAPVPAGTYGREQTSQNGYYGRIPSLGPTSAPGYAQRFTSGPLGASGPQAYGHGGRESPHPTQSPLPGAPQFPPAGGIVVGQAVEMDATTGSPSPSPAHLTRNQTRDVEAEQSGAAELPHNELPNLLSHDSVELSRTSMYSSPEAYVPPRAGWGPGNGNGAPDQNNSPVELPTAYPDGNIPSTVPARPRIGSGDSYYEDVDPRFVEEQRSSQLPTSLQPAYGGLENRGLTPVSGNSYEDIHSMARSPAQSDTSHYTSISQRGINPNWQPPPPQMTGGPGRPMQPQQRDVLFAGSNDFELSGREPGHHGAMGAGGRYPRPNEM